MPQGRRLVLSKFIEHYFEQAKSKPDAHKTIKQDLEAALAAFKATQSHEQF